MYRGRERFPWTPELDTQVVQLVERDGLSYAAVARKLSQQTGSKLTRLAVSGKVHRLKAAGRMLDINRRTKPSGPAKRPATAKLAPRLASSAPRIVGRAPSRGPVPPVGSAPRSVTLPRVAAAAPPVLGADGQPGLTLLEVEAGQCRWTVSDGDDEIRFCGHPTTEPDGNRRRVGITPSFCPAHIRRATASKVYDRLRDVARLSPARAKRLGLTAPCESAPS